MTTKVVDFLNESGGTNFTETAPRPPTYGEENDLQSNGGNSTKSSNSHKSHGSNKSYCSTKSGNTSVKREFNHSPATTPRKSNLDSNKSLDAMTGIANTSLGNCEDTDVAAPLGFEPEGSTANSPPYSESGTPPHLKWAENLTFLLDDSEGVMLFRDFMEHELAGGSEELQFWFACQGFKKRKVTCSDFDHAITDIQKAIYKRYVRSDKVKCISKAVKKEIADKISNKNVVEPGIFDAAQEEVEASMRNETYPAFLLSHYYLEYVQNYMDSPKSSLSSGSNSARPVSQSGLLPVVHEDKELESVDFNFSIPLPPATKVLSTTKKSESLGPMRHAETLNGSTLYSSRRSYYPSHISYAPVSAQDSELQSLSSDALTDDTLSVTDSNADSYSHRLISKKHHRKAIWKTLASHNREVRTGLHTQIIPRTERAPKDRNLAEVEPNRFAGLLIDKLNRLAEEIENTAKVEEKLLSITTNETEKGDSEEKVLTSFVKANTSASFIPLSSAMEEETAESILDQHCSRIWESSSHHTPSYSPPRPRSPSHRSPSRHKDSRKKGITLPPTVSASSAYPSRGCHKKREFVSYDIEDRSMIVCGTETHRHIHHHHHHHHSSRDTSFKKTHIDIDSPTCAIGSWRTENPQNIASDFSNVDYANRGRTYLCKNGSNIFRKSSDTTINIDSGISVMDSVKSPLNLSHPNSEKVMKWMMNSEIVQEVSANVQESDKSSSSHRRTHRLNQSANSSQPARTSSKSRNSAQSASAERSAVLATWNGANPILPSQPIVQDPSMPLLTPPNPTTQLEEAKRRLETQSKSTGVTTSSPLKSKSLTGAPAKDKTKLQSGGLSCSSTSAHNRTLPSARTVPTHLDTAAVNQSFDSRLGQQVHQPSLQSNSNDTIIGIYMGQEPIPYRHQLPGRAITLAQIKTLVTKRGPFKFYFKRHSDEFGDSAGAVFEEISDDRTVVPMWQGKIVVKVEKLDL